jgi:Fe2+ transport system protein FeoA
MPPLYSLQPGDVAVVAVPGSTDPEVVEFLDTLGLRPGVRVAVLEKHPFDGPIVLRVDELDRTVSQRVAEQIFVRVLEDADASDQQTNTPEHRREQSA